MDFESMNLLLKRKPTKKSIELEVNKKYPLLKMMVLDTKYGPNIKIEAPEFFSFIPNRYYQYLKESGVNKIQDMINQGRPIYILSMGAVSKTFYWMRRNIMAKPLLKHNIGALILENPYYGLRKPHNQYRSNLHNVSDILIMGGCLSLECLVLLEWLEKMGFGPLGISGLSMGGFMASVAATNWPKPLVVVPCLSWSTASSVFTEGVMSDAINWDLLQKQYFSDSIFYNTLAKECRIIGDPSKCNLSHVPEYAFNLLHTKMINATSNKYLTPYEILSMLQSATRNTESSQSRRRHMNSLFSPEVRISKMKKRAKEAVWFMRGVMDEFSHLKNYTVPFDTSLITTVCAKCDGYVPRKGYSDIKELWPGSSVRFINCGHIGAYLWHTKVFRDAIVEAFEKAKSINPPCTSSKWLQ